MPSIGSLPKAKAPKQPKASTSTSTPSTLSQITLLSSQLPPSAPSNSDLNPLADLVTLFASLPTSLPSTASSAQLEANRQSVHTGLHSLKATFEHLINAGRLHGQLKLKEGQKVADAGVIAVKAWLGERYSEYLAAVAVVVGGHWDVGVRVSALSALMNLLRTESAFLTSLHPHKQAQFAPQTFAHILAALLTPQGDGGVIRQEVREEWKKWFDRYDDIRYYFLKESAALVVSFTKAKPAPAQLGPNLLSILEDLNTMPTASSELNEWFLSTPIIPKSSLPPAAREGPGSKKRKLDAIAAIATADDGSTGIFDSSSEDEAPGEEDIGAAAAKKRMNAREKRKLLPALLSLPAHRKAFQDAWLALLTLPLDEAERKRILIILHRQVLPHMTDAKRFMDWLVDCADAGGTVGILALNGLFTLIQKHGLEFPDFFGKLYSLLDREVLHVRYRPRFFRLLEIFMGSSHLPSNIVASFIKRLARLALAAPPAAIVTIIPFTYNLLKLHPSCLVMIHRPARSDDEDDAPQDATNDPFDMSILDPNKTRALESSLWELATLRNHYLASVSGLAKIFAEVMNKEKYLMEDFLDHSYGTMFETEVARQIRNAPALAPVPKRQPIGDSFFPTAKVEELKEAVAEDEDEEMVDPDADAPVDVVSSLWTF